MLPSELLAVRVSLPSVSARAFGIWARGNKREEYSVTGSVIGLMKSQYRFAVLQRLQGLPPSHFSCLYEVLSKPFYRTRKLG
jgi:hypothetical protein